MRSLLAIGILAFAEGRKVKGLRSHVQTAVADPPQQVHLAYGAPTANSITVSWVTNNATGTSAVQFGFSPTSLNGLAYGAPATTYLYTYDHHVTLLDLNPQTTYFYSCGDAEAGFSPVYNFTTAPAAGAEFPYTVALIADMGNWNSNNTFVDLGRVTPDIDVILQAGDISYADDAFLHDPLVFGYEAAWNTYMQRISDVATTWKPLMVLPGNHEAECHSPICFLEPTRREATANFTAFNHRFRMPSAAVNGTLNMWYSWQVGSIHFAMIDTETDYPGAPNDDYASHNGGFGDQMAWLRADLAAAYARRAAREVSWIIVAGHRPLYSVASADATTGAPTGGAAVLATAVEGLFNEFGVDLYVSGHVHGTEVQWPVFNTTHVAQTFDNPPYPTYLVVGGAGCDEGLTDYSNAPLNATKWSNYVNGQDYGLTLLRIQDANTLTWDFRRATDGTVLKSITLTRQH